jgi:hypothetical protein
MLNASWEGHPCIQASLHNAVCALGLQQPLMQHDARIQLLYAQDRFAHDRCACDAVAPAH